MLKRIIAMAGLLIIAVAAPGLAQGKVEATVLGGWSFSDGVSGQTILAGDGNFYDRIDPKDGALFGLGFGVLFSDNAEAGFMWTRQSSKLLLGGVGSQGSTDREIGDFSVMHYHGYLAYNFGEVDAPIRPFLYGGLGATHFGSTDFSTPFRSGTIDGNTQFSTTWGAGVKFFVSPRIGFRAAASWTPTYVKSDASGYWCDPFWGCYLVGDPQYSNQIHLSGGVTFRF